MGRPVLAIGGVALIGLGIAIGLGWWWPSSADTDRQVGTRIGSVLLATQSGDVEIRTGDVSTTTVHQRLRYTGSRPGDAFKISGGQLVLAGCGHDCTVDYELIVPRGTTVSGNAGSGDVAIEGAGATEVTSRSGEVRVLGGVGPVKVRANSGEVSIRLASPQNVQVDAGSGDVSVVVPAGHYRVRAETGSGDQRITLATDPNGPYQLDLRTRSGDVTVNAA
jgi:putative adhesin